MGLLRQGFLNPFAVIKPLFSHFHISLYGIGAQRSGREDALRRTRHLFEANVSSSPAISTCKEWIC